MKKVLLFAPVFALTMFFAACQKDNSLVASLDNSQNENPVSDRLNCGIKLTLSPAGASTGKARVAGAGGAGALNYICPTSGGGITVNLVQDLSAGTYNLATTDTEILLNARFGPVNYSITDSNGNTVAGTLALNQSIVYDVTGNCDVVASACN